MLSGIARLRRLKDMKSTRSPPMSVALHGAFNKCRQSECRAYAAATPEAVK